MGKGSLEVPDLTSKFSADSGLVGHMGVRKCRGRTKEFDNR